MTTLSFARSGLWSGGERKVVEAIGAEVLGIVDGKIKEIRDHHRPVPAKAA